MLLADWAGRYPLKQFKKPSGFGQSVMLFGPNGVYLSTLNLPKPEQVDEHFVTFGRVFRELNAKSEKWRRE